jgi:hypothetical protein
MSRTWPPYRTIRELVHAHVGRPAVVMGGGASLLPTLDQVPNPAACIYISANDHGARALRARARSGEVLAYVVCLDKIEDRCRREQRKDGRWGAPWNVPLISPHMFGDYRVLGNRFMLTGITSAWLARLMGCDPIYLAGMDNYVGPTYFDNPTAHSTGRYSQPREHLQKWAAMFRHYPANYIAGGQELRKYLPGMDHVAPPSPVPADRLQSEILGRLVEVVQGGEITGRHFPPGVTIELKPAEAEKMSKAGIVRLARPAA